MFETFDASALLDEVECSRLDESAVWAHRMAAIAPLLWRRTLEAESDDPDPGYALITGFARTVAEVGPALGVAPAVASKLVGYADALDTRLPQTFGLLASGRLDWESTKAIVTRTDYLGHDAVRDVDRNLAAKLSGWERWSRTRLLAAVDTAIRRVDPAAAKERRVRADAARKIVVTALPNGTAGVRGSVPVATGAVFDQALTELAATVCPKDPRTLEQRRVDALTPLAERRWVLRCECGDADCPAAAAAAQQTEAGPGGPRFVINVIAPAATVTGDGDEPGYLDGYGVIDAEQVRQIAEGGALVRTVAPPAQHGRELVKYQPSAAVLRWVRCRSLTCSFPGCNRSAWRSDVDHSVAFDHQQPLRGGWTVPWNLDPKCRVHHRLKTFHAGVGGWQSQQLVDGTVIWTSPTGRVYRSTPEGAELFDDLACAAPTPRRRNRRAEKTKRIAAARAGAAAKRAANAETRRVNQARAKEIADRQWRNEMRFKLFWFKGAPSTSPWCTWVNDPDEDEHISADWRPPPPPPTPDDDEPPF